jgi:hypothetical protein
MILLLYIYTTWNTVVIRISMHLDIKTLLVTSTSMHVCTSINNKYSDDTKLAQLRIIITCSVLEVVLR